MGKNFALYGVGKGVGIGAFGELRSGEGGGVPPVPLLGSYDLFGGRLFLGASHGGGQPRIPSTVDFLLRTRPEQKVNRTQIF